MENPCKLDSEALQKIGNMTSYRRRADATIHFIDEISQPAIDCGEDNTLKRMIEDHFSEHILSYDVDFDYKKIQGRYKTIFCFELLEHLYNPLFFLESLKSCMDKDSILYLSTPRQFPAFLITEHHFHEIPMSRLQWLFDWVGFETIKRGKAPISGYWWQCLRGVRPFLRHFQYTRLFKLKLKS